MWLSSRLITKASPLSHKILYHSHVPIMFVSMIGAGLGGAGLGVHLARYASGEVKKWNDIEFPALLPGGFAIAIFGGLSTVRIGQYLKKFVK